MVTLHSKMLVSSTKPAENPSTGCLQRSAIKKGNNKNKVYGKNLERLKEKT